MIRNNPNVKIIHAPAGFMPRSKVSFGNRFTISAPMQQNSPIQINLLKAMRLSVALAAPLSLAREVISNSGVFKMGLRR